MESSLILDVPVPADDVREGRLDSLTEQLQARVNTGASFGELERWVINQNGDLTATERGLGISIAKSLTSLRAWSWQPYFSELDSGGFD